MRITDRTVQDVYSLQWNDDPPELWATFTEEPTDEDLDAACKERGLWEPGKYYPTFTIWCGGADICAGGGPNSGTM